MQDANSSNGYSFNTLQERPSNSGAGPQILGYSQVVALQSHSSGQSNVISARTSNKRQQRVFTNGSNGGPINFKEGHHKSRQPLIGGNSSLEAGNSITGLLYDSQIVRTHQEIMFNSNESHSSSIFLG